MNKFFHVDVIKFNNILKIQTKYGYSILDKKIDSFLSCFEQKNNHN
jgi:hypothetical protein